MGNRYTQFFICFRANFHGVAFSGLRRFHFSRAVSGLYPFVLSTLNKGLYWGFGRSRILDSRALYAALFIKVSTLWSFNPGRVNCARDVVRSVHPISIGEPDVRDTFIGAISGCVTIPE